MHKKCSETLHESISAMGKEKGKALRFSKSGRPEKNRNRSNRTTHLTLLDNDAAILAVSLSFFIQK